MDVVAVTVEDISMVTKEDIFKGDLYMKIAIPVLDGALANTNISPSFGRAPFFLLFDTETEEKQVITNSTATASQGGAGIIAAQLIVDQGAEALLTPRCGKNAAEVITAAGVKIYKTVSDDIQESIQAFNAGELKELENIHPGFHHHGGA